MHPNDLEIKDTTDTQCLLLTMTVIPFLFLYCLILPVNKYHLGTGFNVMKKHKNIIPFTINIILNFTVN